MTLVLFSICTHPNVYNTSIIILVHSYRGCICAYTNRVEMTRLLFYLRMGKGWWGAWYYRTQFGAEWTCSLWCTRIYKPVNDTIPIFHTTSCPECSAALHHILCACVYVHVQLRKFSSMTISDTGNWLWPFLLTRVILSTYIRAYIVLHIIKSPSLHIIKYGST